ncbi:putative gibberellin-regulated protein 6-like [Capsicum annuum]|nr:putative gibberellin-regulated protein 6-like [Capsicum annuum]
MNGCLHNIYESVENLDDTYIQSKHVISQPKCPLRVSSVPLLLRNDIPTLMTLCKCNSNCFYTSDDPSTICPSCRSCMSSSLTYVAPPAVKQGVTAKGGFVKEVVKYMVMDDLVVEPVSIVSSITGLNKYFNVKDVNVLQEELVDFGKEEALKLLKSSFETKAVLISVFMSHVKTEK